MFDDNVNNENIDIICTVENDEKYLCDSCLYCGEFRKKYCYATRKDCPSHCTECEYHIEEK